MKITNGLALVGVALLLWSGLSFLAQHVAEQPLREHGKEHVNAGSDAPGSGMAEAQREAEAAQRFSALVAELERRIAEEPKRAALHTELGYVHLAYGLEFPDAGRLIEALKKFDEALALDPSDTKALLGVAGVSLRVGVFDKAEEFYQRYLAIDPDNSRVLSDYALSLIRQEKLAEAEAAIKRALEKDPDAVPVLMVAAMVERQRGDTAAMQGYAQRALALAEDVALRTSIESFLNESVPTSGGDDLSKEKAYFQDHAIIGPKVTGFESTKERLRVLVQDFPVAAMPEVAKQQFFSKTRDFFSSIKSPLGAVDIVDMHSKQVLLEISLHREE